MHKKSIEATLKQGSLVMTKYLRFFVLKHEEDCVNICPIVSKKVFSKAVCRNTFKRVQRALLRENITKLPPGNLVVIANHSLSEVPNEQMYSISKKAWNRLLCSLTS